MQHRLRQNVRPVHHVAPNGPQHPPGRPPAKKAHRRTVEGGRGQRLPIAGSSRVSGGRGPFQIRPGSLAASSVRLGAPSGGMCVGFLLVTGGGDEISWATKWQSVRLGVVCFTHGFDNGTDRGVSRGFCGLYVPRERFTFREDLRDIMVRILSDGKTGVEGR